MNFDEDIRDFLIESADNLASLDSALVQLEQTPGDPELICGVFRTIHTIKGTCGFFGFDILGSVTHLAENLLDEVREGKRRLNPALISLILEAVDHIKLLLASIEATGGEGEDHTGAIRARLQAAQSASEEDAELPPPEPALLGFATRPEPPREAILADATIRVDVALLNRLMNMVGELVLARNQLLQNACVQNSSVQQTLGRLNLITSELQEGLMKTRMQPVGTVWNKLPRVVRDLAARCGKSIQLFMEGASTELDRTVIEAIKDPLTHIVRNACDHGIETPEVRRARGKNPVGTLLLRAYHEGGVVHLEISDDGAGLDPERLKAKALDKGLLQPAEAALMAPAEALRLIFMPGFSTAAQVTSISGRGVGMDVVKTNIEAIGGSVHVGNRPEGGATIRIQIPLTLAIVPGLVVSLLSGPCEARFLIPQANLLELVVLESEAELQRIQTIGATPIFRHRGKLIPLLHLAEVLRTGTAARPRDSASVLVVQADKRQIALVVDRIGDTEEIVVKPLGRQLKALPCYVGATILGDGLPALILDVAGLARMGGLGLSGKPPLAELPAPAPSAPGEKLLLFTAGPHTRLALPLALVDRLEEVHTGRVEFAAGKPVFSHCGEILPLIVLAEALGLSGAVLGGLESRPMQVVIVSCNGQHVGLVVDRILDIIRGVVTLQCSAGCSPGLLGSALIGGLITDIVDVPALLRQFDTPVARNALLPHQSATAEHPYPQAEAA